MKMIVRVKNGEIIEILSDNPIQCLVIEHDTEDLPEEQIFTLNNEEVFVYEPETGTESQKEKIRAIYNDYRKGKTKKKLQKIWPNSTN